MTSNVVPLFDEVLMMQKLRDQAIELIQTTKAIAAIKKLVELHDLFHLNTIIQEHFKTQEPTWDLSALKAINHARVELLVFHQPDLPAGKLSFFNGKILTLLHLVRLRNNKFSF